MATLEQIGAALKAADAAGNVDDARKLAAAYSAMKGGQQVVEEDPMRQGAPAPEAPPQSVPDMLSAGFTAGVNAVPVLGPKMLEGAENAKALVQNNVYGNKASPFFDPSYKAQTQQDVAAADQSQVQNNPVASTAGAVAGTVLPFVAGGEVPVIARLFGMTGPMAARVLLGGGSSAGLEFADALSRGDDLGEAGKKAALAGGVGGAFPVVERGVGNIWRMFTGQGASKEAQNVARALRDDQVPVDEVNQRLTDLGPDSMMMDLGPNLQAQAGALAAVPGPGQQLVRDAVTQRGRGAGARVAADVDATIGTGPDIAALRDQIVDYQSRTAGPLYDTIRDVPIEAPGIIKSILQRPMGQQAIRAAVDMAANDGFHFPTTGNVMTVGLADYIKRSLDDIAASAARSGNGNAARQARNMARTIARSVDRIVPAYRTARDAFAGPAAVLDALEQGSGVWAKEMSPSQLRSALQGMSGSERQAFLAGAQSQVEAMMGNAVNDVAALRNTFRKGYNEAKLRILLGDQITDDLLRRIDRELAFGNTANAVSRNSETARRQASMAEVSPTVGQASQPSRTFLGLAFDAFNAARNAVQGVRQPQINEGMGRLLTAGAGGLRSAQLRQLRNAARMGGRALVAPAAPAMLEERARQPIQITVNGGA